MIYAIIVIFDGRPAPQTDYDKDTLLSLIEQGIYVLANKLPLSIATILAKLMSEKILT